VDETRAEDGKRALTIWTDEATFREFVAKSPRTSDAYRRWRNKGIPMTWLLRAGYPRPELEPHPKPLP
jgi:hypothetical protein